MDGTAKRLTGLLEGGDIELRTAAIQIITHLEINSRSVIYSLGRALREDSDTVKLLALKGLMKLGAGDVVEMGLVVIEEDQLGGVALGDLAGDLGADRATGAGDQDALTDEHRAYRVEVDLDLVTPEQVFDPHVSNVAQ